MAEDISQNELERAYLYYDSIREHDRKLYNLQNDFSAYVFENIGAFPVNNGSFGLWLNLTTSDLDLAVGVSEPELDEVLHTLTQLGKLIAVRQSTPDSSRHVFHFEREGVTIDLGVLPPRDFEWTVQGMNNCRAGMTHLERVIHVWTKSKLLQRGLQVEYAKYKLEPYEKYFNSHFIFTPI